MKESFILYTEQTEIISELSDEEAGKLLKAIYAYANGQEVELEGAVKLAFIPIRQQIDRNNAKYEQFVEKQKLNGKKGGRPKESFKNEETPKTIDPPKISIDDFSESEKTILFNFAKKAKAKNPRAYIKKLIENGDFKGILKEELNRISQEKEKEYQKARGEPKRPLPTKEEIRQVENIVSSLRKKYILKEVQKG